MAVHARTVGVITPCFDDDDDDDDDDNDTCDKYLQKMIFYQPIQPDSASTILYISSIFFFNSSNLHLVYTNEKTYISSKHKSHPFGELAIRHGKFVF